MDMIIIINFIYILKIIKYKYINIYIWVILVQEEKQDQEVVINHL